jgi:hypothetical protein
VGQVKNFHGRLCSGFNREFFQRYLGHSRVVFHRGGERGASLLSAISASPRPATRPSSPCPYSPTSDHSAKSLRLNYFAVSYAPLKPVLSIFYKKVGGREGAQAAQLGLFVLGINSQKGEQQPALPSKRDSGRIDDAFREPAEWGKSAGVASLRGQGTPAYPARLRSERARNLSGIPRRDSFPFRNSFTCCRRRRREEIRSARSRQPRQRSLHRAARCAARGRGSGPAQGLPS